MIAAAFLYWIKRRITWQGDMVTAARRGVPLLIGIMVFAFSAYLVLKGLGKVWKASAPQALGLGVVFVLTILSLGVIQAALSGIYSAALYRYATAHQAPAGFGGLERAFLPRG